MHVLVIPVGTPRAAALARRLARTGAAIVLVADDETAEEAGRLAAELGPGRAAVFIGDHTGDDTGDDTGGDGLEEFLQELFSASA